MISSQSTRLVGFILVCLYLDVIFVFLFCLLFLPWYKSFIPSAGGGLVVLILFLHYNLQLPIKNEGSAMDIRIFTTLCILFSSISILTPLFSKVLVRILPAYQPLILMLVP